VAKAKATEVYKIRQLGKAIPLGKADGNK